MPATLHIIASLMNNSFKSNTFARAWKLAEVTCVPKDGDAENPCNNRPIWLLPVLSKVNERLAHRQFVNFLDDNNKLSQFQRGNSKHHSTETALLAVTDDLLKLRIKRKSQYWRWWTCQKPVTVWTTTCCYLNFIALVCLQQLNGSKLPKRKVQKCSYWGCGFTVSPRWLWSSTGVHCWPCSVYCL